MRPNRYIILLSILLGAFGTWFSADAVGQYLTATRSIAAMDVRYVEDSFVWHDPEYQRASAEFVVVNESELDVTVLYFGQQLYFDGVFAGARYQDWDPLLVPAGETTVISTPFFISISELRPQGGEAELVARGQLRLDLEGIERDMTVPMGTMIGRVSYQEDDQ